LSSVFVISTCRDANPRACLEAFQASLAAIAAGEFTDEELDSTAVRLFSRLDAPVDPHQRGI
jgi:Zn-dependent M16 (insulinase) family peptidase